MKKIKKKVKLKSVIILLIIISIIALLIYLYFNMRLKNIYVKGINLIKEKDIVNINNLYEYPKITDINKDDLVKKIEENPLVNTAKVKINLLGKMVIEIDENKLLYRTKDNHIVLSNKDIIDNDYVVKLPLLINDVDEEVFDKFINKLGKIDRGILAKISEIEYTPSTIDKEKFTFLMDDGNIVYVTLSKITSINTYNEIYPTLEGKKGILHLDSGNHFEIKQ